jgi:hypothetical protein
MAIYSANVLVCLVAVMSHVIKSTRDGRLQRILNDTGRLERMQAKEQLKEIRCQQLMKLKKSPLPVVEPLMKFLDAKCDKCNGDKESFVEMSDWHMMNLDALAMEGQTKGWKEWAENLVLRKFLALSIKSLVFHPAQINMLKKLQLNNVPVLFVLKSDNFGIDALLAKFVMRMNNVELPVAFVGDQLKSIPMADSLKMKFEAQVASGEVLKQENLMVNFESVSSFIAVSSDIHTRLHFLPLTINYEKLAVGSSFKWCGSDSLGIVKLNFHEPYTLRDILHTNDLQLLSNLQVKSIDDHMKHDLAMKRPVMSTNVVAFLLLTKFRDGATPENIAVELDRLRNDRHNIDFGFEGDAIDVVERGIEILGRLVDVDSGNVKPKEVGELVKYAEVLTPHFALESILVIAAMSLQQSNEYIDYGELMEAARKLSEFLVDQIPIVKPCEDLSLSLDRAFDRLTTAEVLTKPQSQSYTENEIRSRKMAKRYESENEEEDDDGYRSRDPNNEVTMQNTDDIEALKNVTYPILEAFLTVVCILKKHARRQVPTSDFIASCLVAMREECEDGKCLYWESCSADWMTKSLEYLRQHEMIEVNGDAITVTKGRTAIEQLIRHIENF